MNTMISLKIFIAFLMFGKVSSINIYHGQGKVYQTNLRKPYLDIYKTSQNQMNKLKNKFLNYIHEKSDTISYKHKRIVDAAIEMESVQYKSGSNVKQVIWSPFPIAFNEPRQPLSIIMYDTNDHPPNKRVITPKGIMMNPLWSHEQIPLIEMKYSFESFSRMFYKNYTTDYSELYVKQPLFKDYWDIYMA